MQVVDFQWNPADPWTLLSVADEAGEGGGGTLQLWRISDFVYRPDEEVLAELEPYRDYIITGQEAALQKKPASRAGGGGGGNCAPAAADGAPSAPVSDSKGEADTDAGGLGGATDS